MATSLACQRFKDNIQIPEKACLKVDLPDSWTTSTGRRFERVSYFNM